MCMHLSPSFFCLVIAEVSLGFLKQVVGAKLKDVKMAALFTE